MLGVEIARLSTGEMVGEFPFFKTNVSATTVKALEKSLILSIPLWDLTRKLRQDAKFSAHLSRAISILLADRLEKTANQFANKESLSQPQKEILLFFAELNDSDIDWMISAGSVKTIPINTILLQLGRPIEALYLLLDGKLTMSVSENNANPLTRAFSHWEGSQTKEREFALISKGDIVGETAFLGASPPSFRQNQLQKVQQNIAQLEVQLQQNSQVISPYNGRVLEVTTFPGQVVSQGTRIATIQAEERSGKLTGVAFFPIGEGKKIHKGMKLQITPASTEREQFGGIVASVTNVSAFPVTQEGALRIVGNSEVVQSLMAQGPQIQVFAELQLDNSTVSGYKWSSSKGPQMKVSSGTTATVRVTTEELAPISFVFPLLKSLTGVN